MASDALEGRDTGTRGQKMAAAYLKYHFKANGLEACVRSRGQMKYIQKFYLVRKSPGETWMEANGRKFVNFSDLLYTGMENSGEIKEEGIFVGSGSEDILAKIDLNGKDPHSLLREISPDQEFGEYHCKIFRKAAYCHLWYRTHTI